MQTYLVGGAVRDLLMGREPHDRDYVVVGSTPNQMIEAGFKQVGADFPVFLHPQTGEEYALARVERKTGNGYAGFATEFTGVSLYDDLARRDLTCNAIAIDPVTSDIIDPFAGGRDIQDKVLRHVSEAFREDPVRVLRIARLAAKLDFDIAPETSVLCREMVASGELDHLTVERVRQELLKAMAQPRPSRFFTALNEVGALHKLFPEVYALIGQTQPADHHAEGDAFAHTMMVIDAMHDIVQSDQIAGTLSGLPSIDLALNVFAALCHDLGKGLTPAELLPKHHGHEDAGVPVTEALCDRLKMPGNYQRAAVKATRFHGHVHRAGVMKAQSFVRIFEEMGGLTQLQDMEIVARTGLADEIGRIYERVIPYKEHTRFIAVMKAISDVRVGHAFTAAQIREMSKDRIIEAQHNLRIAAAKTAIRGAEADPQEG